MFGCYAHMRLRALYESVGRGGGGGRGREEGGGGGRAGGGGLSMHVWDAIEDDAWNENNS